MFKQKHFKESTCCSSAQVRTKYNSRFFSFSDKYNLTDKIRFNNGLRKHNKDKWRD